MWHHVRSLTRPLQMWFLHAFQSLHFDESQPSPEAKLAQSKVCEVGPFEETLLPPCARLISMTLRGRDLPFQLALSAHMQHHVDTASARPLSPRPHRVPATRMHTRCVRAKTLENTRELHGSEQLKPESESHAVEVISPRALEHGHCNAQTDMSSSIIDDGKSRTPY